MLKKLSFTLLILFAIITGFQCSFTKKPLGELSNFSTSNNEDKDIRVQVQKNRPVLNSPADSSTTFYILDAKGIEMRVEAPLQRTQFLEMNPIVILHGHLHEEYFHASRVSVEN